MKEINKYKLIIDGKEISGVLTGDVIIHEDPDSKDLLFFQELEVEGIKEIEVEVIINF